MQPAPAQIAHPSFFVGLLLRGAALPYANYGHVVLAQPSPVLFYPISSTEVPPLEWRPEPMPPTQLVFRSRSAVLLTGPARACYHRRHRAGAVRAGSCALLARAIPAVLSILSRARLHLAGARPLSPCSAQPRFCRAKF